jgi:hypothetical protein
VATTQGVQRKAPRQVFQREINRKVAAGEKDTPNISDAASMRRHWKSTEGMKMNFYKIVFADCTEIEEYGDSEADIRDFLARCYSGRAIRQICML